LAVVPVVVMMSIGDYSPLLAELGHSPSQSVPYSK